MSAARPHLAQAMQALSAGAAARAEAHCRDAIAADRRNPAAHALLARVLSTLDRLDEARAAVDSALKLQAGFVPALMEDVTIARRSGDLQRATARLRSLISRVPPEPMLHAELARTLAETGDASAALLETGRALALAPSHPEATLLRAQLLAAAGDVEGAERECRRLLSVQPGHVGAWSALGEIELLAGRPAAAADCLRRAVRLAPTRADVLQSLTRILDVAGAPVAERIAAYRALLSVAPTPMAWVGLAVNHWHESDYAAAAAALDAALAIDPGHLLARWARFQYPATLCFDSDDEARAFAAQWRAGLAWFEARLDAGPVPADLALRCVTLATNFFFHYQGEPLLDAQRRYARVVERLVAAAVNQTPPQPALPGPGERIRVAVFSAHLSDHTVMRLFGSLIGGFDPARFEVVAFHADAPDAVTRALEGKVERVVSGKYPLEAWVQTLVRYAPHVLLLPDLGMHPLAQGVASLRIAPVQAVMWGHPVTTGMTHVDAFLTADAMEPADGQRHYSEALVRLPALGTAFARPTLEPVVPADLAERDPARVEYAYVQSVFKHLPLHDALFARIAAALPSARFHLTPSKYAGVSQRVRGRLARALGDAGLDPVRHIGIVRGLVPAEFFGLLERADIALDSIGWSGGNTSLETLWHNTPIVTLPGETMRSRHTAAMLELLELPELIARDADDYVRIAVELGRSADLRASLSARIAERKHRLYEDPRVAPALAEWCAGAVAAKAARG
jgi:predicted O-linked N-acetylglucosamine transferase (SPINDLY family)